MEGRGILVHEWLSRTGGAENVFDALVDMFPQADLLCLWNDAPDRYPGRRVRETWIARTPLRRSKVAASAFIVPTWRRRRSARYDWALVSSHMFAHHVSFTGQSPEFRKYVYAHTPARYLWNPEIDGRGTGAGARLIAPALRGLDRRRAQEAFSIATNSEFVRDRVQRAWERDAEVIHPPVNVGRIQGVGSWADELSDGERSWLQRLPRPFLLGASRFVPYKRLDLVIETGEVMGLPVVLVGSGPEEKYLREKAAEASVPVSFALGADDALLYALFQAASAFVFPPVEDFGIVAVEAMAAGTPVVVGPMGGAREAIEDNVSGVIADGQDARSLADAVTRCIRLRPSDCARRAARFDTNTFTRRIREWLVESDCETTHE